MPDYYRILEIDKNASQQDIKAAYKRLALICHPDKESGNQEKFTLLQEAYETLSDPDKRRAYDAIPLGINNYMSHYRKKGLDFKLAPNPHWYTHYEYLNGLLKLPQHEQFKNGQDIKNKDEFWFKLDYIAYRIGKRQLQIDCRYPKPQRGDIKKELDILSQNSKKIAYVKAILLSSQKRKDLYDLSLGIVHSEELKHIGIQVGGRERLLTHIQRDPYLYAADGIYALRAVNCLTPVNFNHLVECKKLLSVSMILDDLLNANLLTQANFDFLLQHKKFASGICSGMGRISPPRNILNQTFFEVVVRAGKHAKAVGSALGKLHYFGILNEANWKTVAYKIPGKNLWNPLWEIHEAGLLTPIQSAAVLWTGPVELRVLNQHLDKIIAHGLFLLSCDIKKGKEAFLLGIALKQDLKAFFEKDIDVQEAEKEPFKKAFLQKLHSQDEAMSCHRAEWKVIVANVAIAFTGLGVFAIGVNYLLTGHCFFAQTKREKLIETVEHTPWLESVLGS